MPSPLITISEVSKTLGTKTLFEDLSFGVNEKERIGLIGTNGAGKSTLLKILSGIIEADTGEVQYRNKLVVSYVPQEEVFDPELSVEDVVLKEVKTRKDFSKEELVTKAQIQLSLCGFEDLSQKTQSLSGGWRKRLSLAKAFAKEPDLLILDEPTNHLDWDGIFWLESFLKNNFTSYIIVSHDRDFINNLTNRTIEISRAFEGGFLAHPLPYYKFLEQKEELLKTQKRMQKSMENIAQREDEWLKAGVKARTTKNQGRIKEANKIFDELGELKERNRHVLKRSNITIQDSDRKTKKLIEAKKLNVGYPDLTLIKDLNFVLGPKTTLGLVGHNGSGKTTLIRSLITPDRKDVKHAKDIKIVYFSQERDNLPDDENLMDFLGDGSRYVIFKDRNTHVASYASQFLFGSDKMTVKISELSGGERARLSLAKALLNPCDVLILDEPTNDLDVETIEVLEQIIETFNGLCILVSHDRKFLKKLCDKYLYINGKGDWTFYASLNQCLDRLKGIQPQSEEPQKQKKIETNKPKKKLSYLDKKFLDQAEQLISKEEDKLSELNSSLEEASKNMDSERIKTLSIDIAYTQKQISELYDRWDSLTKE
jgi:ATP-binding cassette subfamily F protein uup